MHEDARPRRSLLEARGGDMATHASPSFVGAASRWTRGERVGVEDRRAATKAPWRTHRATPTRHLLARNAAADGDPTWGLDLDSDDGVEGVEPPQGTHAFHLDVPSSAVPLR